MPFDAFISYSSKDKVSADAACAVLEGAGVRCWIAPRDILPGGEYAAAIIEAIDKCRVMVLIFSSSANDSRQIHREIERAVAKGLPIVPVRIEEIAPTKSMEYFLGAIHWLDALTPPIEKHLHQLAGTVKAILQADASRSPPNDSVDKARPLATPDRAQPFASAVNASSGTTDAASKASARNRLILTALGSSIGAAALLAAAAWFYQRSPAGPAATQPPAPPASGAATAITEKYMTLARTAKSGIDSLIAYTGAWDRDCNAMPVTVVITSKPMHGTLSAANGDEVLPATTPGSGSTGTCAGRTIKSKKIMYRSEPGFHGSDTVGYDSQSPGTVIHTSIAVSVE